MLDDVEVEQVIERHSRGVAPCLSQSSLLSGLQYVLLHTCAYGNLNWLLFNLHCTYYTWVYSSLVNQPVFSYTYAECGQRKSVCMHVYIRKNRLVHETRYTVFSATDPFCVIIGVRGWR